MVDGEPSNASFNVSHSGGHGLIGFAKQDGLGVDLEVRAPLRDFDGIGSRVYTQRERRALSAATGSEKADLFYRLWSLKEALIKALGTGFSLSPARFEVPLSILEGERSAAFRFPHLPSDPFWLEDLGEPRFAAARACRLRIGGGQDGWQSGGAHPPASSRVWSCPTSCCRHRACVCRSAGPPDVASAVRGLGYPRPAPRGSTLKRPPTGKTLTVGPPRTTAMELPGAIAGTFSPET